MKFRTSLGTALAAAAGVLALTAGPALAATPVAHSASVSASASTRIATHLSISASARWISPGQTITLTAHLDRHGYNRTVTIFGQDWAGGARYVVARGNVDRWGNLSVPVRSYQNHTFWAQFDGGTAYAPSVATGVGVHVGSSTSGSFSGYYSTYSWAGHSVARVHANVAPVLQGTVYPNKAGENISMTVQVYYKGQWIAANQTHYFQLGSSSQYKVNFPNWPKGWVFRSAAGFGGDARNGSSSTGWHYWTVTS
ncbi:hypothetical protein ABIA33_005663 [Streptacidiphilus sp. MAP12-16]|uniref:hypothetical protein n=1 Tax=Streptacidiphilus sp. MAP12-16 TaxID=3156300 RepID=UPI0035161BB2